MGISIYEFVRKYYTHDNSDKSKPICFLDELKYLHPFFKIDVEDAEPNVGYIGNMQKNGICE